MTTEKARRAEAAWAAAALREAERLELVQRVGSREGSPAYCLTRLGEEYVQSLPDHEAAARVLSRAAERRRRKP